MGLLGYVILSKQCTICFRSERFFGAFLRDFFESKGVLPKVYEFLIELYVPRNLFFNDLYFFKGSF